MTTDQLYDAIEENTISRKAAFAALRDLRASLVAKYGEHTPKFMQAIEELIDLQELAEELA